MLPHLFCSFCAYIFTISGHQLTPQDVLRLLSSSQENNQGMRPPYLHNPKSLKFKSQKHQKETPDRGIEPLAPEVLSKLENPKC